MRTLLLQPDIRLRSDESQNNFRKGSEVRGSGFRVTILPLSQIFYFDGFGIQYSQINGSELMGSQIF